MKPGDLVKFTWQRTGATSYWIGLVVELVRTGDVWGPNRTKLEHVKIWRPGRQYEQIQAWPMPAYAKHLEVISESR